jgi:lysophospholipase L1-like esterase
MSSKTTLLMLGDSLVEWGDWPELLPTIQVINRGIAGEDVEGLSGRLNEEIANCPRPKHIVIMAGTNNLLMGNTFFPAIFRSMLPRLAGLCPNADITLNSLMPISLPGLPELIKNSSQELADVALKSGCRFLDMVPAYTQQCLPITRPCFLADGVHLSTLGYQVWAQEIKHHLEKSC